MIPTPTLPIDAAKALAWLAGMYKAGLAYHPDDDAATVGNRAQDGSWKPLFTPDDAATANYIMGRAHVLLGEVVYVLRPDLWWEVITAYEAATGREADDSVIRMCLAPRSHIRSRCIPGEMREAAERFLSATY